MLILRLIFDSKQSTDTQFTAYLLRFSSFGRSFQNFISALLYPRLRRRETELLWDILPPYCLQESAYLTMIQIKQQEQTLGRQLKLCSKGLKRSHYGSLHAYLPIDLAVETSQPHVFVRLQR